MKLAFHFSAKGAKFYILSVLELSRSLKEVLQMWFTQMVIMI